jgi:hypothetical protein
MSCNASHKPTISVKTMPDILLPALVAAGVSILFGSASAALLSHTLSSYKADKEYRLRRLEELFSAVQTWVHFKRIYYFHLSDIATADTKGDEGVELANSAGEQAQREYYRAFMISTIYFEDLTHPLNQILNLDTEGQELLARFAKEQTDGMKYPSYDEAFERARSELLKRRDEFNEKFFEEAGRVKRGRMLDWFQAKFTT